MALAFRSPFFLMMKLEPMKALDTTARINPIKLLEYMNIPSAMRPSTPPSRCLRFSSSTAELRRAVLSRAKSEREEDGVVAVETVAIDSFAVQQELGVKTHGNGGRKAVSPKGGESIRDGEVEVLAGKPKRLRWCKVEGRDRSALS